MWGSRFPGRGSKALSCAPHGPTPGPRPSRLPCLICNASSVEAGAVLVSLPCCLLCFWAAAFGICDPGSSAEGCAPAGVRPQLRGLAQGRPGGPKCCPQAVLAKAPCAKDRCCLWGQVYVGAEHTALPQLAQCLDNSHNHRTGTASAPRAIVGMRPLLRGQSVPVGPPQAQSGVSPRIHLSGPFPLPLLLQGLLHLCLAWRITLSPTMTLVSAMLARAVSPFPRAPRRPPEGSPGSSAAGPWGVFPLLLWTRAMPAASLRPPASLRLPLSPGAPSPRRSAPRLGTVAAPPGDLGLALLAERLSPLDSVPFPPPSSRLTLGTTDPDSGALWDPHLLSLSLCHRHMVSPGLCPHSGCVSDFRKRVSQHPYKFSKPQLWLSGVPRLAPGPVPG